MHSQVYLLLFHGRTMLFVTGRILFGRLAYSRMAKDLVQLVTTLNTFSIRQGILY